MENFVPEIINGYPRPGTCGHCRQPMVRVGPGHEYHPACFRERRSKRLKLKRARARTKNA